MGIFLLGVGRGIYQNFVGLLMLTIHVHSWPSCVFPRLHFLPPPFLLPCAMYIRMLYWKITLIIIILISLLPSLVEKMQVQLNI